VKKAQRPRSLAKGAVAGLIGGIFATAAKHAVERIYPPHPRKERKKPLLLEATGKRRLTLVRKAAASPAAHWGLGAATGAAYGTLAEFYPEATAKAGASFGMALVALTHDGALPALGLTARREDQTMREKSSELASHIVYGVVTETVRRVVRRMIR
jgi:putative membrane protein